MRVSTPLNTWDVANVKRSECLFSNAKTFNQPLDKWNVSPLPSTAGMFKGAASFDQSLAKCTLHPDMKLDRLLDQSNLSIKHDEALLMAWAKTPLKNKRLGAKGLRFCRADLTRRTLITKHRWHILGDRKQCK